jgi:hypothetical protein
MDGKALFAAILRLYAATHTEMLSCLVKTTERVPAQDNDEEFREQKRRKRVPSDQGSGKTKKTVVAAPTPRDPRKNPQAEVPTKNYFAPLRTEMEVERPVEEGSTQKPGGIPQQESFSRSGRPPPSYLPPP